MTKTKKSHKLFGPMLLVALVAIAGVFALLLKDANVILMDPKGVIAVEQHKLLVNSTLIMLAFGIPVVGFLYFVAWKYREDNKKTEWRKDDTGGKSTVFFVWALPAVVAFTLAAMLVPATHKLEPQKTIASDYKTMKIQVVALRWKWLFIYPEQNIATVNFVQIPKDVPVQFELTADETPMSSFWIPNLGGMLYAMTEHVNRLNLMADTIGDYEGSAAEINGNGFAQMRFMTRVSSRTDFTIWAAQTKRDASPLTMNAYRELLKPSKNAPVAYYSEPDSMLFSSILNKYAGSHNHGSMYESDSSGDSHSHSDDNQHGEGDH